MNKSSQPIIGSISSGPEATEYPRIYKGNELGTSHAVPAETAKNLTEETYDRLSEITPDVLTKKQRKAMKKERKEARIGANSLDLRAGLYAAMHGLDLSKKPKFRLDPNSPYAQEQLD